MMLSLSFATFCRPNSLRILFSLASGAHSITGGIMMNRWQL